MDNFSSTVNFLRDFVPLIRVPSGLHYLEHKGVTFQLKLHIHSVPKAARVRLIRVVVHACSRGGVRLLQRVAGFSAWHSVRIASGDGVGTLVQAVAYRSVS